MAFSTWLLCESLSTLWPMARISRIVLPGIPHHVTQRGNRRQQVFFGSADYQSYLDFLAATSKAFGFEVWSYCLMPNHIHLLLVPDTEPSLRDGIAHLHQLYSRSINRRHGWTGHLWQGRFYSCPVEISRAALVARYIELNPVRARMCENARDYPWSSAEIACRDGKHGGSGFAPLFSPVANWENFLQDDPFCDSHENLKMVRQCVSTGRPLGSEVFILDLEKRTGRQLMPQKTGRKPISNTPSAIH